MNEKDTAALLEQLYAKYGHQCQYCGIEEKDFTAIWGEFYGSDKRGRRLEIDHKNGNHEDWVQDNLTLSCALCNMCKSDKFTEEEFRQVGVVIKTIWQQRAAKKNKLETEGKAYDEDDWPEEDSGHDYSSDTEGLEGGNEDQDNWERESDGTAADE